MLPVPNGLPAGCQRADRAAGGGVACGPAQRDRQAPGGDRDRLRPDRARRHLLLKTRGVKTVVASDLSPARRALATRCGADLVVDPAQESPYAAGDRGHLNTMPDAVDLLMTTMEKLRRLPFDWAHVFRAIDRLGIKPKHPVIFECVGVPGILDSVISSAPIFSRVVGVGVCMGEDRIRPSLAINKEIDVRFVLGYTPLEFRDTLHMLAEGKVERRRRSSPASSVSRASPAAFDALGSPEAHAKILIDPRSPATAPTGPPPPAGPATESA